MSYEIGTASSAIDLLDKIRVVALARGWTVNNNSTPAAGSRWLSLRVGTTYFNLLATSTPIDAFGQRVGPFIYGCQATGYDGGALWNTQPNSSAGVPPLLQNKVCMCSNLVAPLVSYRIFSSPTYIHVVAETAPNVFSHIAMGVLSKYGAYTGGGYMSMSSWDVSIGSADSTSDRHTYLFDNVLGQFGNATIVRADVDGVIFHQHHDSIAGRVLGAIRRFYDSAGTIRPWTLPNVAQYESTPNEWNLITPLLPIVLNIFRGANLFSPIGRVPDLRVVNMTNFNSGDEYVLGGDTWVIIAAKRKTADGDFTAPSSGQYGYAYKKVE